MLLNNVRVTFECCLVKVLKNYFNDVYFNLSLRGYLNNSINDACKIKNCRKCKTKIKKSFTKILTIILSVKIALTLRVKLPCHKCKILILREVLSFIVSEKKIEKKDGRCIGAST
jgi:hypothetical protein